MRLKPLAVEDFTEEQKQSYDRIVSGPRKTIDGPLWAWLRAPKLADVVQEYGAYCRFGTSIARRYAELAILIVAAEWKAGIEWQLHEGPAREAGFTPAEIEAIRRREDPGFERPDDRAVRAFCQALIRDRNVSDDRYRALKDEIGEELVVELVGILGYYITVAITVSAFQLPDRAGTEDPFADLR